MSKAGRARDSVDVGSLARSVSLVGLTALVLSPGLWLGSSVDSALFVLAGVRIRDGYVPYRDLFDNKPPGLFILNAIGQVVMPWFDPWLVSWLLTVVFTAVTILVVDALLRRRLSRAAAFFLSVVCLIGIGSSGAAPGRGWLVGRARSYGRRDRPDRDVQLGLPCGQPRSEERRV